MEQQSHGECTREAARRRGRLPILVIQVLQVLKAGHVAARRCWEWFKSIPFPCPTGAPLVAVLWERRVACVPPACRGRWWPRPRHTSGQLRRVIFAIRAGRWSCRGQMPRRRWRQLAAHDLIAALTAGGPQVLEPTARAIAHPPSALVTTRLRTVSRCVRQRERGREIQYRLGLPVDRATRPPHGRRSPSPGSDCQPAPPSAFAAGLFVPAG